MEISCTQVEIVTIQCKQGFITDRNVEFTMKKTSQPTPRRQKSRSRYLNYYDTMTRTIIILLSIATVAIASKGRKCPSKCSCNIETVAFCNNQKLTTTPTDFTPIIESLYLFNNNIATIPPASLEPLKNLKLLDLSGNRITNYALWNGIFSNLKLLENLMLQENRITKITSDMFKGLTNLARIYLQDNQISIIQSGAFNNLPNLVELKLRNNKLTSFPRLEMTPNLLLLDLDHNKLTSIKDMALSTVNLEYLLLQDNQLTQLRTSIFDETTRLTQLDISNNRLTAVPLVIKSLTSLRTLNMSVNKIEKIPIDTFKDLESLKVLDIHGMGLRTLQRGIIPKKVILNVLDISDNNFECECNLNWLPEYIGVFEQAFVKPGEIKCSADSKLKNKIIKDLSIEDFGCTKEELERTLLPPTASTTTSATAKPQDNRTPWSADPCDVYPCFNNGTCYIVGLHPRCRCATYWTGTQCLTPLTTPTTTTTTRSTTSKISAPPADGRPKLLINKDTITENSVEIILPQTDTELLVSISEIGENRKTREFKIRPVAHPFTVIGLESGKAYNICIHLPLGHDNLPLYVKEKDTLCGSVRTDGIRVINTPIDHNIQVVPSPDMDLAETPTAEGDINTPKTYKPGVGNEFHGGDNPDTTPTENTDSQILYPALGAGIGAVVIIVLVVMFFVCHRHKKMMKFKEQNNPEYIPGSPVDATQMVELDLPTVVHHHHHNHYNAEGSQQNNKNSSSAKKPLIKKQNNQSKMINNKTSIPKSSSTPTTHSLRSSNSSRSSNSGTVQTRYMDTTRQYASQQYTPTTPPIHLQYEVMPQQMNGRANEYVYRNHQNNNNSGFPPQNHCPPPVRHYDHEVMDEIAPLVGNMNPYHYGHMDGSMYTDNYPMTQPTYFPPTISYPTPNSRSAFQPIQSPKKNTVRTPTSESAPITTQVNTAHVLPTSTCLNRNLIKDNVPRYREGVPVV